MALKQIFHCAISFWLCNFFQCRRARCEQSLHRAQLSLNHVSMLFYRISSDVHIEFPVYMKAILIKSKKESKEEGEILCAFSACFF